MTHENDVSWTLRCAYTASLAVRVVEFEAVTHTLQNALRTVSGAVVTFVANTAGQATRRLGCVIQSKVYFVKSRASFRDAYRLAVKGGLTLKEMQLHRVSVDDLIMPDIYVT